MAQRILQYENVLVEASDVCGELDRYLFAYGQFFKPTLTLSSLLALTQAAGFYKLSRPQMVSENVVKIKGGR